VDKRGARRAEVAYRDPGKAPLIEAFRRFTLDHPARRRLPAAQALQFGALVALALLRESTVSTLAGALDLDRTTLTRNLGPLRRRRLVASAAG
jgi:DNA-binding MarR family transcriptional regulator